MILKWLEIGVGVGVNGLFIFVILDDSILDVSVGTFGTLMAFSALAAVNLGYIFATRSSAKDSKPATPEKQPDPQLPPESYVDSPPE